MTSFFSTIIPTSLHIPSLPLPNPMAFLSKQEESSEPADSPRPQTDHAAQPQQTQPGQQISSAASNDQHEHAISDSETHEDHGPRKRKQPHETFIIVRPPPAKNNHPLNLQIQLIPPKLQDDQQPRRSSETNRDLEPQTPTTPTTPGTASSRLSIRSDRSASLYSFASMSVTSLASTASGRRVVPLYNLSAHNVMQNTVLDAGTDAKVAKFLKKGIEVMQVAYLEPIEYWEHTSDDRLDRKVTRSSDTSYLSHLNSVDDRRLRASFSLERNSQTGAPTMPQPEMLAPPQVDPKKQKKPFKLFKRRNESITEVSAVQRPPPSPARAETLSSSQAAPDERLLAPTLGLQPCQGSKLAAHNHNRAISYVWVIKKWMKPKDENWLNKGLNNLKLSGSNSSDSMVGIELRFEWTKAIPADQRRGRRRSLEADSAVPSVRNSMVGHGDPNTLSPPMERSPAPSVKRRSVSPRTSGMLRAPVAASAETSSTNSQSDSEDDDTPWTCTLHISANQAKMRIAALIPAPHHPKLLGQVKIPFPLPDVAVERGEFLSRVDGADNSDEEGLLLTAEDIKDIIASTCLWLVVRESFGGIDKKRKGDGWRLRS